MRRRELDGARKVQLLVVIWLAVSSTSVCGQAPPWSQGSPPPVRPVNEPLVNLKRVDASIEIELRYAGKDNIAGRPIYPKKMPALVRAGVAERLVIAQRHLLTRGYRLKIWDAYRPPVAQTLLWQLAPDDSFVADPAAGRGSLHTWGVAVDATMIDAKGREVIMPTGFDDFTPAAMMRYTGTDPLVKFNLRVLQAAMARGGFLGLRTEWWHFTARNWKEYGPVREEMLLKR